VGKQIVSPGKSSFHDTKKFANASMTEKEHVLRKKGHGVTKFRTFASIVM
jgi:hypothetical protein